MIKRKNEQYHMEFGAGDICIKMSDRVCGHCKNIKEDHFRDKLYCKLDEADYHQGRKTNETRRFWQQACCKWEPQINY